MTPGKGVADAWREFGQQLAQSAAEHAVHLQSQDMARLQNKVHQTLESMKRSSSEDDVRQKGRELIAELEGHNRAAQAAIAGALGELRATAVTLAGGVRELVANGGNAEQVQSCEGFLQKLQQQIDKMEGARPPDSAFEEPIAAVPPQTDPLTGIPNGLAAREAVLEAQSGERPPYLCVIHIQSLDLLNARFGQRIGDQIVLACSQHLANNLCRSGDSIFRWRGPAFVALLDRDDTPAGVSREVSHVCNSIASSFFGEPHRSILIPVKLASTTFSMESRLVSEIFESIERFIVRAGRPAS